MEMLGIGPKEPKVLKNGRTNMVFIKAIVIIAVSCAVSFVLKYRGDKASKMAKYLDNEIYVITRITDSEKNDSCLYSKEAWKDFVGEVLE